MKNTEIWAAESIKILMEEKRTFPPSKDFRAKAHIKSMKEYEKMYKGSIDNLVKGRQ